MAQKAKLFGDLDALRQIMATDDPSAHKKFGQGVRGYHQGAWDWEKKAIVMKGSYEKFNQNPDMAQHLLDTGEKVCIYQVCVFYMCMCVRVCEAHVPARDTHVRNPTPFTFYSSG